MLFYHAKTTWKEHKDHALRVVFTGLDVITTLSYLYTVRSPRWHTAVFVLGVLTQIGGSVALVAFTSAAGNWGGHWIPAP